MIDATVLVRARQILGGLGYRVVGLTEDLFQPEDGFNITALLADGRELRMFLPLDEAASTVVGSAHKVDVH